MNKTKTSYLWYTHHLEFQETKKKYKFEDCWGLQQPYYQRSVLKSPQPHPTRYKCIKRSIEYKKSMYFCNAISISKTTVNICHFLHQEKYFCINTTPTDNNNDDTDDANNL